MSVSLAMALKKERSVTASRGVDKNGPSGLGDAGGDGNTVTTVLLMMLLILMVVCIRSDIVVMAIITVVGMVRGDGDDEMVALTSFSRLGLASGPCWGCRRFKIVL